RVLRTNLAAWGERPWLQRLLVRLGEPHSNWDQPPAPCAFSPDERFFVAALADGLQRFSLADGRPVGQRLPHAQALGVCYSPDGRFLLSSGRSGPGPTLGEARLWDAATGRPAGPPLRHRWGISWAVFEPPSAA